MHDDTPSPLPQPPQQPRDDLDSRSDVPAIELDEADQAGDADESDEKVEETSIDHGVEESFPASDPVSVSITKVTGPAP